MPLVLLLQNVYFGKAIFTTKILQLYNVKTSSKVGNYNIRDTF